MGKGYRVAFSERGVLLTWQTGTYQTLGRAQARLDQMIGMYRRARHPEPNGWYFIVNREGGALIDVVGMGDKRGKPLPEFKRMEIKG